AAIVPRVAAEPTDLDLATMLGREGPHPAGQQHRNDSERPHRKSSLGIWGGRTPKIGVSLKCAIRRQLTRPDAAWRTARRVTLHEAQLAAAPRECRQGEVHVVSGMAS